MTKATAATTAMEEMATEEIQKGTNMFRWTESRPPFLVLLMLRAKRCEFGKKQV